MGAILTSDRDIQDNQLLKKFCGINAINKNDPFWNKLFSFNFEIDCENRHKLRQLNVVISPLTESLLYNTRENRNFSTLIELFIQRSSELETSFNCQNKIFLWQTSNSLLIIRHIVSFLVKRLTDKELIHVFGAVKGSEGDSLANQIAISDLDERYESRAEEFINCIVDVIKNIPINELTRELQVECIRTIFILISSQLYEECITEKCEFIRYLFKMEPKIGPFVCLLLTNFIEQTRELPRKELVQKSDSFIISFASTFWSKIYSTPEDNDEDDDKFPPQSLSSLSSSLLLILLCYSSYAGKQNTFREMLSLFQNSQEVSSLANLEASFKIDYNHLYNHLCYTINERLSTMLLYMLVHKNIGFRNFVFSRINLENLILPLIKAFNDGILSPRFRSQPHQTYLTLIVMLIFSEDKFFRKVIHETTVKNVSWYQRDRPISEITLGGLIILVFIKAIHINTIRIKDGYFHTNSLAVLANLSSNFKHLSSYVCQKIVGLLEIMTKRHEKLIDLMRQNAEKTDPDADTQNDNLHRDITAIEEGIRTVLEIINSSLCNNLRNNADLIYSILYKKDLFEKYHRHPYFQDLLWNIYAVIHHFTSKVEVEENASPSNTSVPNIMDAIKKAAIEWPTDRLKKFPELNFKYVEDESTVDFFVPYIWRLICDNSGIYFDFQSIKLFNADEIKT